MKITNIGPSSFPVGSIDRLSMYSLDFEEFLWAKGFSPSLINELYTFFVNRTLVPEAINNEMMKTFRQFIAVGGMPDAVVTYLENQNDYKNVDIKQRELLEDYYNDIALYSAPYDKIKTQQCYMSLSKQLLDKENHKFQYCRVEKNGKGRKFYSSIHWLLDADLLKLCFNVRNIEYDLSDYKDPSNFRAYTNDLSLLIPTKDFYLKQKIIENSITTLTQKGIYECAIADILLKKNIPLYFYKNENTKKEIDFLIQREGNIVPIEVKSSNKRATSLNWLMEKKTNIPLSYKLVDGNIGVGENNIITIPLYMAMFL